MGDLTGMWQSCHDVWGYWILDLNASLFHCIPTFTIVVERWCRIVRPTAFVVNLGGGFSVFHAIAAMSWEPATLIQHPLRIIERVESARAQLHSIFNHTP